MTYDILYMIYDDADDDDDDYDIDDVYDEEFIVEKEFEDLLLKNNGHSNLGKKMSNPVQSQGQAMQYAEVNNDI